MKRGTKIGFWLAMAAWFLAACDDRIAGGTNDETHTEVAARFYEPDGRTAAVDAVVQVVPHDGTVVAATGRIDGEGRPVVAPVPDGLYKVSVAKAGNVVYVDSVPASGGRLVLASDDTLAAAGSLAGVVAMQPDHDPATVTVNVLGTDIWTNVGSDGGFRLDGLGAGRFRLRFLSTLDDYTTTYLVAQVSDGPSTSLPDTVRMVYTGIPVVTGLSVRNDSLTGDQILSWNRVSYRGLQDYVVYRDTIDALAPTRVRFATVSDTTWRDTTASRRFAIAKWKYRVVVETMGGDTGKWYGYAAGTSVPRELSRLDRGSWKDVGRAWGGEWSDLGGGMTEIVTTAGASSVVVGVRSSVDGLLWDSSAVQLPARKSGQEVAWIAGTGAGRIWCLGRSLLGDGIDVRWSLDGRDWNASTLPDSLWPTLALGGLRWIGTRDRAAVEAPDGTALVFHDGSWSKTHLPVGVVGADDSALYATGGGFHLLSLAWSDRSRILSDLGIPPFSSASRVVRWNGTFAALADGRLWIRDPSGWTLRSPVGLNRLAVLGDRLLVADSLGLLRTYTEAP